VTHLKAVDYFHERKQEYLDDLFQYLKLPSISNDEEGVRKAAIWLESQLKTTANYYKIVETSGNPVILAEWEPNLSNKNRLIEDRTVLIYGHYDVQSPEPLNQWILVIYMNYSWVN